MQGNPDRFHYDINDKKLYDEIEMFKGKSNKEQFLLAMSIGYKNNVKRPIQKKYPGGFFLAKDLRPEDEALIKAVAIKEEGSIEVLTNLDRVFKIAEEYAHAGIKILHDMVMSTQYGSFDIVFEKELFDIYNRIKNKIS